MPKLKTKKSAAKRFRIRAGGKIKLRNLTRFLGEGDKAKNTLRFRGREMAHQEFGVRLLERVKADLEPYGVVEQFPKLEGRQMIMVLGPKKGKKKEDIKKDEKKDERKDEKKAAPAPAKTATPSTSQ